MARLVFKDWVSHKINADKSRDGGPPDGNGQPDVQVLVAGTPVDYNDGSTDLSLSIAPFSEGYNLPSRVYATYSTAPPDPGVAPEAWLQQGHPQGAVGVEPTVQSGDALTLTIQGMPPHETEGGFQLVVEYPV